MKISVQLIAKNIIILGNFFKSDSCKPMVKSHQLVCASHILALIGKVEFLGFCIATVASPCSQSLLTLHSLQSGPNHYL